MRSLALKLTLAFLLVGLTGSVLVALAIRQRTRTAFDQFVLNREQQTLVEYLVGYYQEHGAWKDIPISLASLLDGGPPSSGNRRDSHHPWERFILVSADGQVVFSSPPGQAGQTMANGELENALELNINGKTAGWLILAPLRSEWTPNSPEDLFLQNINRATLLSALVATFLALTLGGFLAYTLTRSLRELTDATVEIARGKLGKQVKVRSKDELGELASSFNKMSRDLERATQARRQMTADIAHELRSPLSVISGYSEALSDGKLPGTPEVYGILHQETKYLNRLVDDLRTLSLADAGELSLILQAVQPNVILERVAARHSMVAQQRGVALKVEASQGLPLIEVDLERIAQVFDNLVTNALRYTSPGGTITLSSAIREGRVQMQVRDTGSGIAATELPHIFDRFYRADVSRQPNGESGLGLAIARSLAEAHGGTLTAESTPGLGSTFTLSMPVSILNDKIE